MAVNVIKGFDGLLPVNQTTLVVDEMDGVGVFRLHEVGVGVTGPTRTITRPDDRDPARRKHRIERMPPRSVVVQAR